MTEPACASRGVEIIGLGHYAPDRVVTSADLENQLGLEPGWILRRTGIRERRYASDDESLSDIARRAAEMALDHAGLDRRDIGLVLLATSTPDHLLPPTAPLLAHQLGLSHAGGIDLAGACGGFIYALALADPFVRSNGKPVLVVAANILSRRINPANRASAVLFADAAGAVVLAPSSRAEAGIVASDLLSDGRHYGLIQIPGGGSRKPFSQLSQVDDTLMLISDGQKVFSAAVTMMTDCAKTVLARAKLSSEAINHLIPHQANLRMMQSVADKLSIAATGTLLSSIETFGNSSAATIPFTLSASAAQRRYAPGDVALMTAAGAGLTGGAILFRL